MIRITVIAALVWCSWATFQPHAVTHPAVVGAVAPDCSAERNDGSDDTRWSAARAGASFTQSNWKFPHLHAELAGVPLLGRPARPRLERPPTDSASSTPAHLLRIPLLI